MNSIFPFIIQLYGLLLLQLFFFCANIYGWYAWTRPNEQGETLEVRWLSQNKLVATAAACAVSIALLTMYIDPFFFALANIAVDSLNLFGADLAEPVLEPDAFPFWDATMTILSIVAQVVWMSGYQWMCVIGAIIA